MSYTFFTVFYGTTNRKKMASATFGVNKKGHYQLCNNEQVLHEIGVFFGKMWNGCRSRGNCKICTNYSFVAEELGRVAFGKREEDSFWCIYREAKQHSFEMEKIDHVL